MVDSKVVLGHDGHARGRGRLPGPQALGAAVVCSRASRAQHTEGVQGGRYSLWWWVALAGPHA